MKRIINCLLISATAITTFSCASVPKGPLFVQVHFTNSIRSISSSQLKQVLNGNIKNFKELGGENKNIEIFVEKSVVHKVKESFPRLACKKAQFTFKKSLVGNRSFIGISDSTGLRPFFKTVYIDNKLPWGTVSKNYVLTKTKKYPFMIKGVPVWNSQKSAVIVQTGVTAMTRGFVPWTRRSGDLYSSIKYIKGITSTADLATTSNEVSFMNPCTYKRKSLRFCSPKKFFAILVKAGFDIIELTGNHNNDKGTTHNIRSISMYKKAGMDYFGGGINQKDAEKVLYKTIKGVTIAFFGANEPGPAYAWAGKNKPGAARASKTLYAQKIQEAAGKAKIIIVTMQSGNENNPRPWKKQVALFHSMADAGATIAVSSSAHRAMGLEFYKGKLIAYGLGNILFDQMHTINHRRGMIARHHFYNGKHISTELIPYLMHNYSQPRIVYGRQARALFNYVFAHSRGPVFK